MRFTVTLILPIAAFAATLSTPAAAQNCDRACLGDIMTRYLESLVAHDPSKAPLADNVRFTEDTRETPIGGGFWATASKIGAFRTDILDVRAQTAAVQAVMEENGTPVLFAARLKVEDREITEIETMVVRGRADASLFDLTRLDRPSAAFTAIPPRDRLDSREEMIDIAAKPVGVGQLVVRAGRHEQLIGARPAGSVGTAGPVPEEGEPALEAADNLRVGALPGAVRREGP